MPFPCRPSALCSTRASRSLFMDASQSLFMEISRISAACFAIRPLATNINPAFLGRPLGAQTFAAARMRLASKLRAVAGTSERCSTKAQDGDRDESPEPECRKQTGSEHGQLAADVISDGRFFRSREICKTTLRITMLAASLKWTFQTFPFLSFALIRAGQPRTNIQSTPAHCVHRVIHAQLPSLDTPGRTPTRHSQLRHSILLIRAGLRVCLAASRAGAGAKRQLSFDFHTALFAAFSSSS
jgi:hypothetical protein